MSFVGLSHNEHDSESDVVAYERTARTLSRQLQLELTRSLIGCSVEERSCRRLTPQ